MKPFADQGNYTVIHNAVFDQLMAELSGSEFKLLMAIIRRTDGYQRQEDAIPLRDFQDITGIGSRNTVIKGLTALEERGLVLRTDDGYRATYALNRDYELQHGSKIEQCASKHGSVSEPKHGSESEPNMVQKVNHSTYREKKERKGERGHPHKNCPMPQNLREDELAAHPLTHALLDAGYDWPGYTVLDVLVSAWGGAEISVEQLRKARSLWLLSGYNPRNYDGMLDWYFNLLQDPAWQPGGRGQNGRAAPTPRADVLATQQLAGAW